MKVTKKYKLKRLQKLKILLLWTYLKKSVNKRKYWVNNLLKNRNSQGHFNNLVSEMRLFETQKFYNYHRMSIDLFDALLEKVKPVIEKQHLAREPICPGARLSLTLRYLASGDSMISLSYEYRISAASTSNIIRETCEALWNCLLPIAFPKLTHSKWKEVEIGFKKRWNFPNCIGALDGKHCVVQAFANSGSLCYNYKSSHSIVLMALCDAYYNFLVVDIGASGKRSDGGVFNSTNFGKALKEGDPVLNIPDDKCLPGTDVSAPFVIVADEAFPLLKHLLRPFPGRNRDSGLPNDERIFDYRLSRARRVVENAFGILSARWRMYRRPILDKRSTVAGIIKATVCLHNWVKLRSPAYCPSTYVDRDDHNGNIIDGLWRRDLGADGALQKIRRTGANNSTQEPINIRNTFKKIFL